MAVVRLKDIHRAKRWMKHDVDKRWENIVKSGLLLDGKIRLSDFKNVVDSWINEPCFLIGGSPSSRGFDFNTLNNFKTITMNHMIEVWDKSKWFIFMDRRFMRITTYDLGNYKGRIFAHVNSQLNKINLDDNVELFHTKAEKHNPDLNPANGLYCRSMTGLAALNLALISGADPIYMIGMDMDINHDYKDGLHYNKGYTGEDTSEKSMKGYISRYAAFKKFLPWKDRIVNVCENGYMNFFNSISLKKMQTIVKQNKTNKVHLKKYIEIKDINK